MTGPIAHTPRPVVTAMRDDLLRWALGAGYSTFDVSGLPRRPLDLPQLRPNRCSLPRCVLTEGKMQPESPHQPRRESNVASFTARETGPLLLASETSASRVPSPSRQWAAMPAPPCGAHHDHVQ
jgi:hypothetical protein